MKTKLLTLMICMIAQSLLNLAHAYHPVSPYAYCNNNPITYMDPNGKEWAYYSIDGKADPTWNWVDGKEYRTGVKDNNGNEVVLPAYETVVVFNGSLNETLGAEDNMYGDGSNLADVIVYGIQGAEDIQKFKGYTMSSDPSKYGVVADGIYPVNRLAEHERRGPYGSDLTINNRGPVNALNNYNPAHPERNPGYLTGVFIHRANNDGWAGTKFDPQKGKYVAVSEGCLLIAPNHWIKFQRSIKHVNHFMIHINRK